MQSSLPEAGTDEIGAVLGMPHSFVDFLRTWFPARRQPVTGASLAPLLLFLLLYAALIIGCEWQGWLRFSYWGAFWVMALAPWFWWISHQGFSGLGRTRSVVALVSRLLLLGLFAALLADPRAVRRSESLATMYTLDVSDSMGDAVSDAAMEFMINTAQQKRDKDAVGLVAFGRNAAVELPPRSAFPLESLETINSVVGKDGTDVAKALSLSAAMLSDDTEGRIILISDGAATEGDLEPVLDQLKSRKIAVDVLPVDFSFEKEVWVERLDLPKVVKIGESYDASVLVGSLKEQQAELVLEENGTEVYREIVDLNEGKKRITIPIRLREPDYYAYTARLIPKEGEDGWEENNVAINDVFIQGEGKVLVVTDTAGDPRDHTRFVEALRASRRLVETVPAFQLARDTLSLMPYDAIVFANVPADALDVAQMQAVRDAVHQQGIGFLMIGGKNSYGPGGYNRSAIEEALPVEMDVKQRKVMPKGAMAIILHTCEFEDGNTWAKRITKAAIKVLSDQDEVGVLAQTWNEAGVQDGWIFPLTPASEYEQLSLKINKTEPGDMGSFAPAMQLGLNALVANDAAMKHMLIISDGDPTPPSPALLQGFVQASISISTILINPHNPANGPDHQVMRHLASTTKGRHYFPRDPRLLPSIFIKEAKELKRSMIQNITFVPEVEVPDQILKGIEAMPQLHGYVLTSPKQEPSVKVILKGPEPEEVNPVLATWNYGTGTAAAYTSDLSPNWAKDWMDWEQLQQFINQLMVAVSRTQQDSDLVLSATTSGTTGVVFIEDFSESQSFLDFQAGVVGPDRRKEPLLLEQIGPRRYKGTFELWGRGRYQIVASGDDGEGREESAVGAISVAYSPEFLNFESDPITLKRIASATGGRILSGTEKTLSDFKRSPRETTRSVLDWFLILLACLIPLDVALRRVQIDFTVIKGWLGFGKKPESGETMSALLRRKNQVSASIDRRDAQEKQLQPTAITGNHTSPTGAKFREPAKPASAPTPGSKMDDEPRDLSTLSTTERLLARKRQREEKKD
jgi:uncharacterized membrane protein/Mg-chelatase subunit ChlD